MKKVRDEVADPLHRANRTSKVIIEDLTGSIDQILDATLEKNG